MTNTPLHTLCLGWRHSFDSLDHAAVMQALKHFGLSDNMLVLYRLFMNQPTFQMQGFQDHIAENKLSMYPPGLSLKSMLGRPGGPSLPS